MRVATVVLLVIVNIFVTVMTYAFFAHGGFTYVRSKLAPALKVGTQSASQQITPDMQARINKIAYFNSLPSPLPDSIIFLGDSQVNGVDWAIGLKNLQIINYGIGGDLTRDVLKRLDPVIERKPQKIFVMVGINDFTNKIDEDTIINNFQKMIDLIKKGSPATGIYVHSILPPNFMMRQDLAFVKPEPIQSVNLRLRKLCEDNKVTYIDIYSRFTENGELKPSLTRDGVHLNTAGYLEWIAILEKYVRP